MDNVITPINWLCVKFPLGFHHPDNWIQYRDRQLGYWQSSWYVGFLPPGGSVHIILKQTSHLCINNPSCLPASQPPCLRHQILLKIVFKEACGEAGRSQGEAVGGRREAGGRQLETGTSLQVLHLIVDISSSKANECRVVHIETELHIMAHWLECGCLFWKLYFYGGICFVYTFFICVICEMICEITIHSQLPYCLCNFMAWLCWNDEIYSTLYAAVISHHTSHMV